MRTRLHIPTPGRADEIGNAGVVWSHGRYDFVCDAGAGSLRISHQYSHKRVDTKSTSRIARQMIDYAIDYLEEGRGLRPGRRRRPGDRRPTTSFDGRSIEHLLGSLPHARPALPPAKPKEA